MKDEIVGMIVFFSFLLFIVGVAVWGIRNYIHHHKMLIEYYKNIKVGDRYSISIKPLHPFDTADVSYGTIINKTMEDGKHPWVQIRYDDGLVDQKELHDFLTFHKKVS